MRKLVLFVLLTVGCSAPPDMAPALPDGVHLLTGIDPTLADGDLAPLDTIVGGAALVGVGESVHTVGGFSRMKVRIAEHLVTRLGVRAIAIEGDRAAGMAFDRFIGLGIGDATEAAKALVVWANTELRDLASWLRDFNQAHPSDPVRFYGFDVVQPDVDGKILDAFLPRAAGSESSALLAGIARCTRDPTARATITKADHDACLSGLMAIETWLGAHRQAAEASTSPDDELDAEVAVVSLRAYQSVVLHSSDPGADVDIKPWEEWRDKGMFESFQLLHARRFPQKTILWAHNVHLAQQYPEVRVGAFGPPWRGMGTWLSEAAGASYVVVALAGYDLSMDWHEVGACGPIPPPTSSDALEVMLHGLALPAALVDFSATYLVAGQEYELGSEREVPARHYQALVYLDHADKMQPLNFAPCTP
jgi:erythromycin esterase-like protein